MKQTGKIWKDHAGKEVPTYAINPVLRLEDKHAHRIADVALRAERFLKDVVRLTRDAHGAVFSAKLVNAKIKGRDTVPYDGMTIAAFDSSIQVKVTKPDNLTFDTTYTTLVKEKFDEYFATFDEQNAEMAFIRKLVQELLFSKGGKIDQGSVFRLRKIRDELRSTKTRNRKAALFIEAVDMFDKAVRTRPGNMGIYVDVYDAEQGKMRRVTLKYTDV
ncbi:MAG: hypothetical protein A3K54_00135 [Omnitrophica WOR_2 bacterium RBG_13_44_8]|nr:MAG: hypothetical protein A3K54_00135 [Omnitrophica WOR_2 bacterium RBG_13_44_8]